jgi:hypothetical protein
MFAFLCIHASMVSNIPFSRRQHTCFSPSATTPCKHNAKTITLRGLTSTRNSTLPSTLLFPCFTVCNLCRKGSAGLSFASQCFSLRILLRQVLTFFIYTIQKLSSCLCIYPLPHTTGPCRQHACILSITSAFAFHYHSTFCSCAWHPTTNTSSPPRCQVSMQCHALRVSM